MPHSSRTAKVDVDLGSPKTTLKGLAVIASNLEYISFLLLCNKGRPYEIFDLKIDCTNTIPTGGGTLSECNTRDILCALNSADWMRSHSSEG